MWNVCRFCFLSFRYTVWINISGWLHDWGRPLSAAFSWYNSKHRGVLVASRKQQCILDLVQTIMLLARCTVMILSGFIRSTIFGPSLWLIVKVRGTNVHAREKPVGVFAWCCILSGLVLRKGDVGGDCCDDSTGSGRYHRKYAKKKSADHVGTVKSDEQSTIVWWECEKEYERKNEKCGTGTCRTLEQPWKSSTGRWGCSEYEKGAPLWYLIP